MAEKAEDDSDSQLLESPPFSVSLRIGAMSASLGTSGQSAREMTPGPQGQAESERGTPGLQVNLLATPSGSTLDSSTRAHLQQLNHPESNRQSTEITDVATDFELKELCKTLTVAHNPLPRPLHTLTIPMAVPVTQQRARVRDGANAFELLSELQRAPFQSVRLHWTVLRSSLPLLAEVLVANPTLVSTLLTTGLQLFVEQPENAPPSQGADRFYLSWLPELIVAAFATGTGALRREMYQQAVNALVALAEGNVEEALHRVLPALTMACAGLPGDCWLDPIVFAVAEEVRHAVSEACGEAVTLAVADEAGVIQLAATDLLLEYCIAFEDAAADFRWGVEPSDPDFRHRRPNGLRFGVKRLPQGPPSLQTASDTTCLPLSLS